jgi:PAS domain S-box-containing protein
VGGNRNFFRFGRGASSLTSDDKFRIMADYSYHWEYWLGPDQKWVYVSPACQKISGYTVAEFMADPGLFASIVHPEDLLLFQEHNHQPLEKGGEPCSLDFRIIHKNGSVRWVNHFCQPVFHADGSCLGRRGTYRDITDMRQKEESLRESLDRFEIISRSTKDVIWDWDITTGRVWWSENITESFGFEPEQVQPTEGWWKERIHPGDLGRVLDGVKKCFKARQEHWSDEYRYRKADDTYAWILDRGVVIYDDSGKPVRMIGNEIDMSRSRELESQLNQIKTWYSTLAEVSPSGIWETDRAGNNTYVSTRWSEITGISREDARGSGWSQGIHPEDQPKIAEGWYSSAPVSEQYDSEFRFIRPDGTVVWVLCIALPVKNEKGEVTDWVGTITDITAMKDKETSLEAANLLLVQKVSEVKTLRGILPICAHCNKVRDDEGVWNRIDSYIESRTEAAMSHGICPDCRQELYPELE